MPDANLTNVLNFIAAAGALGTAAMGLVDAFKVFWGGPSNFGFGYIEKAVGRFLPPTADGPAAFGPADMMRTLRANWLNGVPVGDQKAKARAIIHLRLTKGDAEQLAELVAVDKDLLSQVAAKAVKGEQLSPEELAVLAQFDAVLGAVLDEAYERADQKYRNAAKLLAVGVSVLLALCAALLLHIDIIPALLAGLVAAPVAPVAKDLATALQNAVSVVRAVKV